MTFESILQHLGPSAKPLMDFMDSNMACQLSQTGKYVRSFVLSHKMRWGFRLGPFTINPNGSYVIKITNRHHPGSRYYRGFLRDGQYLRFKKGIHDIWAVYDSPYDLITSGTKESIDNVKKESASFMAERKAHRDALKAAANCPIRKAAEAEAKAIMDMKAKRKAYHDTYTINVGPAPAINPWSKKRAP